jgi:4-carboxymuconolactone decarboxylase
VEYEYLTDRGRDEARAMFGPRGDELMEKNNRRWAERVDGDWARIMNSYIIEGLYSRGVLSTAQRELCAVAALTVLQRTDELEQHIEIALNSNPPDQVREVILQMSVYGGVPVALSTLRMFERVLEQRAKRDQ